MTNFDKVVFCMAINNEYLTFLDPDRQENSRYLQNNTNEGTPLYQKIGLGVLAGAALLAVGHRTGAINRFARFLDIQGVATVRAAREALDNQGSLLSDISLDRWKGLGSDFLERQRRIAKQQEILKDRNRRREYDMQRYLRQREQLINEEIPYKVQEKLRFDAVVKDLRREISDQDAVNKIVLALEKGTASVIRKANEDEIKLLLNKAGISDRDITQKVLEIQSRHRNRNILADMEGAREWIERLQEKFREESAKQIQNINKGQGPLSKAIVGHKKATVQDVLELHESGKVTFDTNTIAQIRDVLKYNPKFRDAVFDESLYTVTKNGKLEGLMDYGVYQNIGRRTMEWWADTIPGGLLHLRDILSVKEARERASIRIFDRGTIQPMLNAQRGLDNREPLHEEVVYLNGKFYKLFDTKAINENTPLEVLNPKRDMYLAYSSFGTMGRITRHVAGLMTPEKKRNKFTETLDLFNQDKDSYFVQGASVFTKFFKDDWERNVVRRAITKGVDLDDYYHLRRYFQQHTEGLTPRTLNQIKEYLPGYIKSFIQERQLNFSRDDDVIELFKFLGEEKSSNASLIKLYREFERNRDEVIGRKTPIGESNPILGEYINKQTGMDLIRREVSLELIRQVSEVSPRPFERVGFRSILDDLRKQGKILNSDYRKASELYNFYLFDRRSQSISIDKEHGLRELNQLFRGNDQEAKAFQSSLKVMSARTNPLWERFSETTPPNMVGDQYIAINKASFDLKNINDFIRQIGLRTGRRNMEDFTTASIFVYYPVYRLQNALGNVWLGLSDKSMGSPMQLMGALFFKRFLPLYAGYEYFQYLDYKIDEWTGAGISERWENYLAIQNLDEARERDRLGLNEEIKRQQMLHPGIEHFDAMPSITIPGIGRIGAGPVLSYLLADNTPIDEKQSYTEEEMYEYYQSGVEEVRKGRWWFAGSKSAYRGDRIIEFRPNDYRLAFSDWEYSDVTSSGEERWGHHILPTFENPLGLLSYALGFKDPYWWERKHYFDRPYMLTGQLFNPNTMVFGDIANMTIGNLIKPVRPMHPEYWNVPLSAEEAEEYGERPTEPIVTRVSPGGRVEHSVYATPVDYGGVYLAEGLADPSPRASVVSRPVMREDGVIDGFTIYDPNSQEETYVPKAALISGAQSSYLGPAQDTSPRGLMQEEYLYREMLAAERVENALDPRGVQWQTQEMIRNWAEPLGVYNWIIVDELLGWDPYVNQTVIQKADMAYNASQRFWEMELGSLGSQLSEIGRRFIRRDSGQLDFYNPIRNTMPDWLPGGDYFINFQAGDPYQKLPRGEYRLPGEAYEKLNVLHPDETGYYGAFDKFKILADVAPWSDEYKFWRDYVTANIEDEELRKEAAEIKRQVSARKRKYEFYEYRFADAELEKMDVTVRKFLDDYTFLTEELGDQPVRLAGMRYQARAEGVLQEYFDVGDTITIAVDADPTKRIADDTYQTIRAVVYRGLFNINQDILRRGLMQENETDFSAPAVWARFTPEEIDEGARWERIAHAESPFNTKFLQVRTALEEYERDQIYGKDWATWENFLISDYLIPAYESIIRHDFAESVFRGAVGGGIIARVFLGGGKRTIGGAIIGGLIAAGGNLYRQHYEYRNDETWIPKRRRLEHDINEYFDILQYLKYSGLYERAKAEAAAMGYHVQDIIDYIEDKEARVKARRRELEEEKRRLYIEQPRGWEEERTRINKELESLSEEWDEFVLPEPVLQALYYKEKRDTTLYAIDPHEDRMKIMRALPYKDRWFFNEFVDAGEEERERILELVPRNQRRIYQGIWGMEQEEQPSLEEYFQTHYLPGPEWEGWLPEYNLEDIKVKVVEEAGLDLSDFNFWPEDVEASESAPDLQPHENTIYANQFSGYRNLKREIQAVMEGQGLYDVRVTVNPSTSGTRIVINYEEDKADEINNYLRTEMESIL